MTRTCLVLPHETADGPANMALDEALLDLVAADPTVAVLRTYEWSSPTLSLGYFQSIAEAEADPRWLDVPVVRRPTGGGALWHDLEVTYAVIIPGDHPASRPSRALYGAVHRAVAELLRSRSIPADRRGEVDAGPTPAARPFLCFADRDEEDVVVNGVKVVGSAQRRRSGAVLQHGSLLLRASPRAPELPGLLDLAPASPEASGWAEALRAIIPAALGLDHRDGPVPDLARQSAEVLASRTYGDRDWTRRR